MRPGEPVCLPCWRQKLGMTFQNPPRHAQETKMQDCSLCGQHTNHGIYLTTAIIDHFVQRRFGLPE